MGFVMLSKVKLPLCLETTESGMGENPTNKKTTTTKKPHKIRKALFYLEGADYETEVE